MSDESSPLLNALVLGGLAYAAWYYLWRDDGRAHAPARRYAMPPLERVDIGGIGRRATPEEVRQVPGASALLAKVRQATGAAAYLKIDPDVEPRDQHYVTVHGDFSRVRDLPATGRWHWKDSSKTWVGYERQR